MDSKYGKTMDSKYGSGATAKFTANAAGSSSAAAAAAIVAPGWYTKGFKLGQIVITCHYEMGTAGGDDNFSKSTGYEHLSYTFYKVLRVTNDILGVAELEKELLPYGPKAPFGPFGSCSPYSKVVSMNYCYARPKNQIKQHCDLPWSTHGSLILTEPEISSSYRPWDPFKFPLLEMYGDRPPNVKIIAAR